MKAHQFALIPEDRLLLAGTGLNLSTDQLTELELLISLVSNWEYFTKNVLLNSLGPQLHSNLSSVKNNHLIPEETLHMFKQTYLMLLRRNMVIYEHFRNAVRAFSENGISVIGLKGIFLAEKIYNDIGLRQLSDIDLLVQKEDVLKCRDILSGMGYLASVRKKSTFIQSIHDIKHLPPLVMNGVSIELHTKVNTDSFDFKINIEDFWLRAINTTIADTATLQLNPVDMIIHLCVHLDTHFKSGNVRFYYICDIAAVVNHYQNSMDWQLLEKIIADYNCKKITLNYLFLCHKYLSAKVPEYLLNKAIEVFDPQMENLFILNVKANKKAIANEIANSSIGDLQKVSGFWKKMRYLKEDIFPSKDFMYKRYKIRKKHMVYLYYPLRVKTGIVSLFKYILFRKKN